VTFEILGEIEGIETIVRRVELHWYEAHGIGRRDFKIKAYAD
jgi:hypothetical protein